MEQHLKIFHPSNPFEKDCRVLTLKNEDGITKKVKEESVHISSKEDFDTVLENIKLFNLENSENQLFQRLV